MNKRRSTFLVLAAILILACSCPLAAATSPNPPAPAASATTGSVEPLPAASATTAASPSATSCTAVLSANSSLNVRFGPGTVYDPPIGSMTTGQTAAIDGKNEDGTWWYIVFPSGPGGHGWVSGSVTTATCLTTAVAVVAAPPTPVPPTTVPLAVTDVSVSVSPDEISVPGCMGPIMPSTASATIKVNGAVKLQWHFVTQQNGALSIHSVNFVKAGAKDVSDSFTPPLTPGTYWVRLVIQGFDLSGLGYQAKYKIGC